MLMYICGVVTGFVFAFALIVFYGVYTDIKKKGDK